MGYRRDKTYRLKFADPEFDGLEVVTLPIGIGPYLRMKELLAGELTRELLEELFGLFEKHLDSWNYENRQGEPVQVGPGCMWNLDDLEVAKAIVRAWSAAMTEIADASDDAAAPDPLPRDSTDGTPFEVGSIPMEPLTESRAS